MSDAPRREVSVKLGLSIDPAYLYFVSKQGHVERRSVEDGKTETVVKHAVLREPGYLYWIDVNGDIVRQELPDGAA